MPFPAVGRLPRAETNPVSRGLSAEFSLLKADTLAVQCTSCRAFRPFVLVERRITTFRLTTDCIYDGGPIRL